MNLTCHPIPDSTLTRYCEIMVEGNTLLQQYHSRLKHKFSNRPRFRGAIFHKVDQGESPVRFGQVVVRQADLTKILAVRDIELAMFHAFAGVVCQQANRWHYEHSKHTLEDLEQEAAITLLDAIYHYTHPGVKFITFATDAIIKRLITCTHTGGSIILPDSGVNRNLLSRYEEACRELAEQANFMAACDYMGLDEGEICHLKDLLHASKTVSQNDIESHCCHGEGRYDFTAVARPFPVAPSKGQPGYYRHDNTSEGVHTDMDLLLALRKLIANADQLPEFDRAVLFAALDGERGWQTELAKQHINKVTGKLYTKAGVRWVLKRLGERITAIACGEDDLASDAA